MIIFLLKYLLALAFYPLFTSGGIVSPDAANSIVMERTNEVATSSYTFYMSLETRLPEKTGIIKISFPISSFSDPERNPDVWSYDYDFNFIITKYSQVTLTQNNVYYTNDGTLTSNYLSASWSPSDRSMIISNISTAINAGSLKISIKFIRNPEGVAGKVSGYFKVETFVESTLVDQNINFGKVTFSNAYLLSNQASISNDGSNLGGSTTNYKYTFSTTVTLPIGTWFRIRFPSQYTFGDTSCQLVDKSEALTCYNEGDNVLILGSISEELESDSYTVQIKNLNNPTVTGFFTNFIFECIYPGTYNVLQLFYNQATGITIEPGQISQTSIQGSPLNMNLRIDYTIQFTPTNIVPNPGKIVIIFPELSSTTTDPNTRSFALDIICRVIYGLSPTGNSVTCTTSGSTMTITDFQTLYSQQIEVKVFATNPGRSATYSPFIIRTYQYDTTYSTYYIIDENNSAGSVQISDVSSLTFVKIDFFSALTNATFNNLIPLDFRLYPSSSKELPLSDSTTQHEISLQIPLLWRNYGGTFEMIWQQGYTPGVTFGTELPYQTNTLVPSYYLHIYRFKTPSSTSYAKYPLNYGLGQCDLPISIASVYMPPFGGKYLFRVLTFKSGVHYTDVPQEQDLYEMDIAIPQFPSALVSTTGTESGDGENVIIIKLQTGITIPYEGAINLNMTTVTIYTESSSQWYVDLGQGIPTGVNSVNVPCSIYVNGDLSGFFNSNHPNLRCYVFKGTALQNVILQIRGFASPIGYNTSIQIYAPNIRLCEDEGKGCYITVNSSYTSDIKDPYILNLIKAQVVSSIQAHSTVTKAANTIAGTQPQYGSIPDDREICLFTTWTIGSDFYSSDFTNGDSIIIIFPSYRFTYRIAAVTSITYSFGSASGSVIYIDYYTKSQTYYLITLNSNVPTGNNLILNNIKNANNIYNFGADGLQPGIDEGVELLGHYWQQGLKVSFVDWAMSVQYTDGGIIYKSIAILPDESANTPNIPVRSILTDMEWLAEVVYVLTFTNCRVIPQDGKIKVKFPIIVPDFSSIASKCTIKSGLVGISQLTLESSITCQLENDGTNNFLVVSDFQEVAQETKIVLIFRATHPAKQASAWNPGAYHITSHDNSTSYTKINFSYQNITAIDVNGPGVFPQVAVWQSFYIEELLARQGEKGYFKMLFTSPKAFGKGSTMTVDFGGAVSQPTSIDSVYDLDGWVMQGYLYCTINGDIAEDCIISGQTVTLLLPRSNLINGVLANVQYELIVGYRGNDDSTTTRDGFQIGLAGDYILSAQITDGSNLVSTQKGFRNLAPSFDNFWIYSINKLNTDTTDTKCFGGGTQICGRTVVVFVFDFSSSIPQSVITDTSETKLILEFTTYLNQTFSQGFDKDLGTGLPQRSDVPCEGFNILPMSGFDEITCRLYLGTSPNPTQIVISNFALMPSSTPYEIHIPDIFNPTSIKQLLQISLRAETTITATASPNKGLTTPIYDNSYLLVNMTNTIRSHLFHQDPVDISLTSCNPTFTLTDIDTYTTLDVCFQTGPTNLQASDHLLFQFPKTWKVPRIDLCALGASFAAYSNICYSYNSNKQILIPFSSLITGSTLYTASIYLYTPPYAAINPVPGEATIVGYTFWRSRLVSRFTLADFTQTLVALTIPTASMVVTATSLVEGEVSEYTIKYDVIRDIPDGGCIQIIVPVEFKGLNKEGICRNAILSGSDFDPYGYKFACTLVSAVPNDYLVIHDFGPFKLDYNDTTYGFQTRNGTTLYVNFRVNNPSLTSPSDWIIKQWYKYENPLNLLVATGQTASPTLTPPVIVSKWEKLLQTRLKLYTEDIGPLEFIVFMPFNIAAGYSIQVQMPSSFTMQNDAEIFCYWDLTTYYNQKYPARTCSIDSNKLVTIETPIQAYLDLVLPTGSSIPASTYVLIGISTLDNYYGINGVIMPSISTFYDFTMRFPGTPDYVSTRRIYLPHKNHFQIFEPTTLVNNPNEKTVFDLYVTTTISCDSLILKIPVLDQEGNDLYDEDLGTGFQQGQAINCQYNPIGVQTSLTCSLYFGDKSTNTHAQINISGAIFSAGTLYQIAIDQIVNPNVLTDDRHVYMILEGYSGGVLVTSEINYDFSFKYIQTSNVLGLASDPTTVSSSNKYPTVVMGGSGAGPIENNINYQFSWSQQVATANSGQSFYDYFIIEFPRTGFNIQPLTVSCNIGTCRMLRGWNWAIWKYSSNFAIGATVSLTVQGLENAKVSSTTIHLLGYTVKNRVIVDKKYFLPLSAVTPISPSSGGFTITAPDYPDVTKIPISQTVRYQFTLALPIALQSNQGVIDFIFPSTSYVPINFCQDTLQYPIAAAVDYINCVYSNTQNSFSVSGFGDISTGATIQLEGYATNPSSAVSSPSFTVKIYQDSARTQQLLNFNAVGPSVSAYQSFVLAKHLSEYNQFIRTSTYGEFLFYLQPGISLTETVYIYLNFPNSDVNAQGVKYLSCGFQTTSAIYEAASCIVISSSPLTIQIYGPVDATLSSGTTYKIYVTVRNAANYGLYFSGVGETYFEIANSASLTPTTRVYFTIYPTADFNSLATLSTTFENAGSSIDVIVNIQTSTPVPIGGKLIVAFPTIQEDGSTTLFDNYLGKSGLTPGSPVDCAQLPVGSSTFGCIIESNFKKVMVSLRMSSVLNQALQLLINGITLPSFSISTGHIPVEVYTVDEKGIILEAMIFESIITPYSLTPSSASGTITQLSTNTYQYSSINIGTTNAFSSVNDRLVIKFPLGYDLSSATFTLGTAYSSTEYTAIGNIMIVRLIDTINSGSQSFQINNVINPTLPQTSTTFLCYVVVGYVAQTVYSPILTSSTTPFSTALLTLTSNSQTIPLVFTITFSPPSALTGSKTVYFLVLKSGVISASRYDNSLACSSSTDPIYCILLNAGTYYGVTVTFPVIIIYNIDNISALESRSITILNIQEYTSASSLTGLQFLAVNSKYSYLVYSSTLSAVSLVSSTISTPSVQTLTLSSTSLQIQESSLTLSHTIHSSYVSGSFLIFYYDSIPTQSLSFSASSANIKDNGTSIGTCTIDSTTFYTQCTLTAAPNTTLDLELTNFPNPTVVVSSSSVVYQTFGVDSASHAFQNSQFTVSSPSALASSNPFTSPTATQTTDNVITLDFTLNYVVPSGGKMIITLGSSPATNFNYLIVTSQFQGIPIFTLSSNTITITGFSLMASGSYSLQFGFEIVGQVPSITQLDTFCNQFSIESVSITQTTSISNPSQGIISVNTAKIVDSKTILILLSTQNTIPVGGFIQIQFDSNMSVATFNAQQIDSSNISDNPIFKISGQYLIISKFGTYTAGSISFKIFFSTFPANILSITTISPIFNIIDTYSSSISLTNSNTFVASTVQSLGVLNYNRHVSIGGNNEVLTFQLQFKTAITASSEQLMITFPSSIDIDSMLTNKQRIKCNVRIHDTFNKQRAKKCHFQKLTLTYLIIQDYAFSTNTIYDVSILRVEINSSTRYFWGLPSTASIYYFIIDKTTRKFVQDPSIPTITTSDSIKMEIYSTYSTNISFTNNDGSISKPSLYNVQFTATSSTYYMDIEFPLAYSSGSVITPLFSQDLGSSLSNGISFTCFDKGNTLGTTVKYRLFYGIASLLIPSRIRILFTSSSSVNINIQQIYNPSAVNKMVPITIKTGSLTGTLGSSQIINYAVYTLSYSPTTTTLSTPSFSPTTAASSATISMALSLSNTISIDKESHLKFQYDPRQYKSTMSVTNANTDFSSASIVYFSTLSSQASSYTLSVNNILTPPIIGTFTFASYIVSEISNRKVRKVFTGTVSQILTAGGNFIISQAVSAVSFHYNNISVLYSFSYNLQIDQIIGNTIIVKFPSDYVITSSTTQKCWMLDSITLLHISSTCSVSSSYNGYMIILNQSVPSGIVYYIKAYIDNPTSARTTGLFTLYFFKTSALSELQSQPTIAGVVIVNTKDLIVKLLQPFSMMRFCQQDDTCPIRFSVQFTSNLSKETDSIVITNVNFITSMISLQTTILELACWIDNYASYYCYQDTVANTITIQTPVNTVLSSGTTFNVFIQSWRDPSYQPTTQYPSLIRDFILLPTYSQSINTPTIFKDVQISIVHSSSSTIIKKDWQFVNKAFNWKNPAYFCSYSTTINYHTILKVRFQMPSTIGMNSGLTTQVDWGMFVIYMETKNEVGQTLIPYILDTRFIKDGQEIDCICANCLISVTFLCYVNYGGTDISAPVSITIRPQQYTNPSTLYLMTFPKIKLPTTINYFVRISMKALQYDSSTLLVMQLMEILGDFIFYTNSDNVVSDSKIALSFPGGSTVGQPCDITWSYSITPPQLGFTRDRLIITTPTPQMIIEHPINPSGILFTTSDSGSVWVYPLVKWMEIEFLTNLVSSSKSVITYNFKNMPYQITAGVDYEVYTYAGGEQRNIQPYFNIPFSNPHILFFSKFQYTVSYISQPNTVTFIFQPYNKVPIGGYFSVYWGKLSALMDNDWVFQNSYCRIVTGLQDAQCIIVSSELRIVLYDFSQPYDPVTDGVIKFYLQVQNSGNAGLRQNFSVTSFWDLTGYNNRKQASGYDVTLSHMIDENLLFSNFSVVYIDLLSLTLLERYQEEKPVCGGSRGPIVLKLQFRQNYSYPHDFIEINFFQQIQLLATNEELICYFADTTNAALVYVKTFRCDLLTGGIIQAYVPEETNLYSSKIYLLYLTVRTQQSYNWGIQVNGPSAIRWTRISTSQEGSVDFYEEIAWIEAKIPPCPFNSGNFRVTSFSHEYNTASYDDAIFAAANAEKYLYTYINVTLQTINNAIGTGNVNNVYRTRIVFEFPTHNEIFPSWDEDITGNKYTTAKPASCGQLYNSPGNTMVPDGQTFLSCTILPASGQMPETPAYIIMEGHPQINSADIFNVALGRIKNPNIITDGTVFTNIGIKTYNDLKRYQTSAHMGVRVQQKQADGTFYDINKQWRYYLVPQFLDAANPINYDSSTWKITYYYTSVTSQMRNVTVNIYPLGQILSRLRSAVVLQYSYPYEMVNWSKCYQHNYFSYPCQDSIYCDIPHGRVGCVFLEQSRWLVFSNNIMTNTSSYTDSLNNTVPAVNRFLGREQEYTGYRLNPPFTYLYGSPKSLFRAWIYDKQRTVGMRTNYHITPTNMNCGLVMETTHHDNPQNRDVLYRIGLYISTRTNQMQTIRLLAPNQFQNFQHCKVKKGIVLVDFSDISNEIKCTITYQSSNWKIEITNFTYNQSYEDGFIILEFLVTNPYDSGWTNHWNCRTFTQGNELMIHDYTISGYGRTWVGKYIPYPNLFRVYRNTISFQNRRATSSEYAELHMRIIPAEAHPETDDTQYTQIQIWMPLTYDIPNGGTTDCYVDHIYHTDIGGQYCQITSDRKIFVQTNRYVGLPAKCGLVSFTTIGSIGNNNGVLMPSSVGNDEFEVFITSQDSDGTVKQEYSDLSAATSPVQLTTTPQSSGGDEYSVTTNVHMNQVEARIVISFYAPVNLPAGYDTSSGVTDSTTSQPIGYIEVGFNTEDDLTWYASAGWNLQLIANSPINPFDCKSFSGLVAPAGKKLLCTIVPSTMYNYYFPVKVVISNFEAIAKGTYIELHLLNIPAPPYSGYSNAGWMYVSSYEVDQTNQAVTSLISQSQFILGAITLLTQWDTWTSNRVSVSPNRVGAYSTWIFSFDSLYDSSNSLQGCFSGTIPQITFAVGTIFVMKIPTIKFELVDNGDIQATLGGISMKVWIYENTNQIFFRVEQSMTCGNYDPITLTYSLNTFKITQMRNAAFAFSSPYSILIDTYSPARLVIRSYLFTPISNPQPASFTSTNMYLSKYYSDERYVNYTYEFSPSYKIPVGSQIQILLPQRVDLSFPNFGTANPQEICIVSNSTAMSAAICMSTFSSSGFVVSVLAQIPEQTALKVVIAGTRNPVYSSATLDTDFSIQIIHPLGSLINSGNFHSITYLSARPTSYIYLSIKSTSNYQGVIADYTFTIQSTTYLPLGGFIYFKFPVNYLEMAISSTLPVPSQLTGSWRSTSLVYTYSWTTGASYYTFQITPSFAWPAKTSLVLKFSSFPNPISTTVTDLFSVFSMYDNKQVDVTDPTDFSPYLTYSAQPDPMDVSFSFTPQNEGVLSTYSFGITASTNISAGSFVQLTFDSTLYSSTLSSTSTTVTCYLNNVQSTCTIINGVVSIPITSDVPSGTPLSVTLTNVMNPTEGSSTITGTIVSGSTVISYNSGIGPVSSQSTPYDLIMSKLTTTSTALGKKSSYNICVSTNLQIDINDIIYIIFPSQFSFKGSYQCSITSDHSSSLFPYNSTPTSPLCVTSNAEKKITISGQSAAKTSSNTANLCYQIDGVENPSAAGQTDNFQVKIFDTNNQVIKCETSGLTSTITTLTFNRDGYQVIVKNIPDLPKGVTTNDILIELEIAVSYFIYLIPYLVGFEFIPPIIVFNPTQGQVQTFKIKPLNDAALGTKLISWTKNESTTSNKFSEMADTVFNFISAPYANSLKAVLQTKVSRTALLSTSLPIEIVLNQPASEVLTISYFTKNHLQDSQIVFTPSSLVFQPGVTSLSFRYKTLAQAVSGTMMFELDSVYSSIYILTYPSLSFEILNLDTTPPSVINYYIEQMDRTYIYLRISSDESVIIYSMLTLLGTEAPTTAELYDSTLRASNGRITDVLEYYSNNSSYIAPVTIDYIYYDTYLYFQDLEEQTSYQIYFMAKDLSGNLGAVMNFTFTTLERHLPAHFKIRLNQTVDDSTIFSAFGLITALSQDRFSFVSKPDKFSISENIEDEVQDIIDSVPIDYEFILLPNKTSNENRPLQIVAKLQDSFDLLQSEFSANYPYNVIDSTYQISSHAYEMLVIPQEFRNNPTLQAYDEESASFYVSITYEGTAYGIVQLADSDPPYARQIKKGLNSTNYALPSTMYKFISFQFTTFSNDIQQNITKIFSFSGLLDNTDYIAYFIAENNQLVSPDLMSDQNIKKVNFRTDRESITIPDWFKPDIIGSALLKPIKIMAILIVTLILKYI